MRRIVLAAGFLLSIALPSSAGEMPGKLFCTDFLDAPGGPIWVDAYMTAINDAGGRDVYGMSLDSAVLWMAQFCRDNPRSTVLEALRMMTKWKIATQGDAPKGEGKLLTDDEFFGRRPL